jgi:hypothetical protein
LPIVWKESVSYPIKNTAWGQFFLVKDKRKKEIVRALSHRINNRLLGATTVGVLLLLTIPAARV